MIISKAQIKKIHALLGKNGKIDPNAKALVVSQFTGSDDMRSTKDLSFDQANALIRHLGGTALDYENWAVFDKNNTQHTKILSLCHELGWVVYSAVSGTVVDLKRLSEWLKSFRSPVKKPLLKMKPVELSKTISALEGILTKNYKREAAMTAFNKKFENDTPNANSKGC